MKNALKTLHPWFEEYSTGLYARWNNATMTEKQMYMGFQYTLYDWRNGAKYGCSNCCTKTLAGDKANTGKKVQEMQNEMKLKGANADVDRPTAEKWVPQHDELCGTTEMTSIYKQKITLENVDFTGIQMVFVRDKMYEEIANRMQFALFGGMPGSVCSAANLVRVVTDKSAGVAAAKVEMKVHLKSTKLTKAEMKAIADDLVLTTSTKHTMLKTAFQTVINSYAGSSAATSADEATATGAAAEASTAANEENTATRARRLSRSASSLTMVQS